MNDSTFIQNRTKINNTSLRDLSLTSYRTNIITKKYRPTKTEKQTQE